MGKDETRGQAWMRLVRGRFEKVKHRIWLMRTLADRRRYDFNEAQVDEVISKLHELVADLEDRFRQELERHTAEPELQLDLEKHLQQLPNKIDMRGQLKDGPGLRTTSGG